MKLHLPLFKAISSALITLGALRVIEIKQENAEINFLIKMSLFLCGWFYTHFFEYAYHRFFLHDKIKFLDFLYLGHAKHHYHLFGKNFVSRDPEKLKETLTSWHIFPILFFAHYFLFVFLFGFKYSFPFFCGITAHFLCYQITHWCTHVKDNALDIFLRKTFLKNIWNKQVLHHMAHHNKYFTKNFNFTYPFLGDCVFKTLFKTKK